LSRKYLLVYPFAKEFKAFQNFNHNSKQQFKAAIQKTFQATIQKNNSNINSKTFSTKFSTKFSEKEPRERRHSFDCKTKYPKKNDKKRKEGGIGLPGDRNPSLVRSVLCESRRGNGRKTV
jgi:flagellin-like hook-associated protein FlgL